MQSKTMAPFISKPNRLLRMIICINSLVVILLALVFFFYPPIRSFLDLNDPALKGPGVPQAAWRLYKNLTPEYAEWAKNRVVGGRAESLSTKDISGTEWPLFGSVFYLWGIENLQSAWEANEQKHHPEPRVFAKDAIIAASELVIDPKHAAWVKKHWGADYLHRENVFYRMLVMAALTSREKLLHDGAHLDLLRDQVETFTAELDASKTGLLDDYPYECYPADVMAAIMCVKRADEVLGTDHSRFINRAIRGFVGTRATRHQLPPYSAGAVNGAPTAPSRGCGNSYMCLTSPELWPAQAKIWYSLHERYFWQRRITAFGFREFANDLAPAKPQSIQDRVTRIGPVGFDVPEEAVNWGMDVDAGPVIAGHGVAASAFGMGAARKNGRFDHAYPLSVEMLITAWELPTGVLAAPRLLSNVSDAPLLGEAAYLWLLTVQPEAGFPVKTGGAIPLYFYVVSAGMLLIGTLLTLQAIWKIRRIRSDATPVFGAGSLQIAVWLVLVVGSVVTLCTGHGLMGMMLLVVAVLMPVEKRQRRPRGAEDWPSPPATAPLVNNDLTQKS
jgi:hypothetical protein